MFLLGKKHTVVLVIRQIWGYRDNIGVRIIHVFCFLDGPNGAKVHHRTCHVSSFFFVFHCFTSAPKTFDMERRKSSDWWMDEMLLCCGSSLFTREDFQVDFLIEWVHVIGWVLWRHSGRPVVFVMGCCRPVVSGNMMNLPKLAFSSEFEVSEILKSHTQMDVCMYVCIDI